MIDSTVEGDKEVEVIRGGLGFALVKSKISHALNTHIITHTHTRRVLAVRDDRAGEHCSWSYNQSVSSDKTLDKV